MAIQTRQDLWSSIKRGLNQFQQRVKENVQQIGGSAQQYREKKDKESQELSRLVSERKALRRQQFPNQYNAFLDSMSSENQPPNIFSDLANKIYLGQKLPKEREEENRLKILKAYKERFPMLKTEGMDLSQQETFYRTQALYLGQFKEGIKEFWVSSIKPTIGYNLETLGRSLGLPKLTFIGQQIGDELLAEAMKRPELSLSMEDLKKKFKESPSTAAQMAVGRFSGGSMPYMGTSVIGGVVGGLIGGPVGAKVGMFTPIYTLEKSNLYKDLIQDKVDPVVANKAADIFGVISALIEMGIGYTPQGITKAIKSGARKAFKQSWKMFLTKEFPKMITRWQLKTAEEGGEEGLQYLAEKIVRKWIKAPESDIVLKDMATNIAAGYLGALPFGVADILQSNAPEAKAGLTIENIEARKRIPKRLHPLMEKVVEFGSAKEFFDKLTSPEGIKS